MRKYIQILLVCVPFLIVSCKKEQPSTESIDQQIYTKLQGQWRATQKSSIVNGSPSGQTQNLNGNELIFKFNNTELLIYNGEDNTSPAKKYSWKVMNGEVFLRAQYADSANIYTTTFEDDNHFLLIESYQSGNNKISVTIRFSRF
ncbi:hypothetical protein [Pedobacter agri]|uniref:Lipocalin-like domain-containing protein n=1 Tax=Pedobacter agri TaxID=454586 RepID=A0A9X3DEU1_9SPHI|nr:hypothetical protein [Pedobacter agri]MCX3264840.1 hypothetical protein [Pedobacter agri]